MEIRRFERGDEAALFRVHVAAIRESASHDHPPAQIEAWAPAKTDMDVWTERVRALQPFVAELDGVIVGHADLLPDGLIDHFHVSGACPRRGIGTRLMARSHEEARVLGLTALTFHVSRTAEPSFWRHGFQVVERHFPVRCGVTLENAAMRKEPKRS